MTLPIFLGLFLDLLAFAAADCDKFTPVQVYTDTTFTSTFNSIPISNVVNCTGDIVGTNQSLPELVTNPLACNSTQCPLAVQDRYLINLNRTLNISGLSESSTDAIFDLVEPNFPPENSTNFNASWAYVAPQASTCRNEGSAGWWSFTPIYRCIDGVLGGCGNGDPADGTAIRACGIVTEMNAIDQRVPYAVGDLNVVEAYGFENINARPNATLQPGQEQNSNSAHALTTSKWLWTPVVGAAVVVGLGTIW